MKGSYSRYARSLAVVSVLLNGALLLPNGWQPTEIHYAPTGKPEHIEIHLTDGANHRISF